MVLEFLIVQSTAVVDH